MIKTERSNKMEQENWTVAKVLDWTSEYFQNSGIPESRIDAEILLSYVMGFPRLQLYLKKDEPVGKIELSKFKELILERKSRKPISYILGEHEFMGLKFKVNSHTLIPRPETELLVEEAVKVSEQSSAKILLEIGTGSGNIAGTLAKYTNASKVYSCDLSLEALRVAQENIDALGVSARVILKQGDVFEAFKNENLSGRVDIIISNPPYVALDEKDQLLPELSFEPQSALFGGQDGLDFYRRIAKEAGVFLKKGGYILFEMNANKSAETQKILVDAGYKIERISKDYSGFDRIAIAKSV